MRVYVVFGCGFNRGLEIVLKSRAMCSPAKYFCTSPWKPSRWNQCWKLPQCIRVFQISPVSYVPCKPQKVMVVELLNLSFEFFQPQPRECFNQGGLKKRQSINHYRVLDNTLISSVPFYKPI